MESRLHPGHIVRENATIHRLVEQQAAIRGDGFAYLDGRRALTYRQLNARANVVARALVATGFRRGSIAAVRIPVSPELAVALLAVLKAGGAYRLIDPDDDLYPFGLSAIDRGGATRPLDVVHLLDAEAPPSANLPILTRGNDIACVMGPRDGGQDLLVPHATITSLQEHPVTDDVHWSAESGALDLWVGLMTGATVTATGAPSETVAA